MAAQQQVLPEHEDLLSLYELFIGMMTVLSLVVMAVQFLFHDNEVLYSVLWIVDNLFCFIFLGDFTYRIIKAESKIGYLKWHGTFDLLGSIPAFPALRIFRLFRLTRVARVLRIGGPNRIIHEFLSRRSESALYLTIIMALLVITFGSIAVYYAESFSPNANITSGQDAVWWSVVTITTVGYGDRYPVTWPGRIIGMMTMVAGIGVFGVFTSFLATSFMAPPKKKEADGEGSDAAPPASDDGNMEIYLGALRLEVSQMRHMLEQQQQAKAGPPGTPAPDSSAPPAAPTAPEG